MKAIINISIIFVYLLAMCEPVIPYIEYMVNKTEIVNSSCKQRFSKHNSCQGKCYIQKKVSQSDSSTTIPTIEMEKYPVSILSQVNYNGQLQDEQSLKQCFSYFEILPKGSVLGVFFPPDVMA